jgi:hypothetical protein
MSIKIKPIQNIECNICLSSFDKTILYKCNNERCINEVCNICINKIIKEKTIENKCPYCRDDIIVKISKKNKIFKIFYEFSKFFCFYLLFSILMCSALIIGNLIVTNIFPLVIKILEKKNNFVLTFLVSGFIGFGILFITLFLLTSLLFIIKINLCKQN